MLVQMQGEVVDSERTTTDVTGDGDDHHLWETHHMPTCDVRGITVNYLIAGDDVDDVTRPRVLFFNGSGATLESAALLISYLARTCTVLAHDQRGLGKTSVPEGPYTMADYAADGAALLDHVGWTRCAVVGVSFGGMVAQEFAVTYPERVQRLALLCTSAGGEAGSSYPLHEMATLAPADRARAVALLTDSRFTPEWLAQHPSDAEIIRVQSARAAADKSAEQLRGERLQLEARIGHDVSSRLSTVRCPVLVAAGRYDGIAPVANSIAIAERLADASVAVYEGGHLFTAQDPQALRDVSRFLATGERPSAKTP